MLNSTNSTLTSSSFWTRMSVIIVMILIDISAFLGNLLVVCAFFRTRRLQTVTNYFIASLAFADALVAVFVLPLGIYYYHHGCSWKLGLILCDLWVSSDVLLCTSSILNLTCISVDRYMAITKPLSYTAYRSKFLARLMILLVWIVSAVITCPPIFGWRDENRKRRVEEEFQCELNKAQGYVIYSSLGSFYIPGLIMIFVYVRIFMAVYDRGNLITNFQNTNASTTSLKPNTINGILNRNEPTTKSSRLFRCISCRCFQRSSRQDSLMTNPLPVCSFNHGPAIEQKQNGYLVYRFTNGTNNVKSSGSTAHSSQSTAPMTSKTKASKLTRSAPKKSTKFMSNISDEHYSNSRNYLTQNVVTDFAYRTEDSSKLDETPAWIPVFRCRSRSFEQSTPSKVRDLNAELSHSRQLKAAAEAAAAITTADSIESIKGSIQLDENELDQFILPSGLSTKRRFSPSGDETRPDTTQSLTELTQIVSQQQSAQYSTNTSDVVGHFPMRARATTNPSLLFDAFSNSLTNNGQITRQNQELPEPTRINRRVKSSRDIKTMPSAILIENFKQQYRVNHHGSLRSFHSSKSLASLSRSKIGNDLPQETIRSSPWRLHCCRCLSSTKTNSETKNKIIQYPTPNQSLTNDDDDDEKISSNEASIRTPNQTTKVTRTTLHPTGTPGDVQRRERIRFMKEKKTAKILAVVVGGFILLWLPFFIMYVIPRRVYEFSTDAVTFITWLGYFNSVINPFIYAYCSKQFRMAFWNITIGICMKKSTSILPLSGKNKQIHQRRVNT